MKVQRNQRRSKSQLAVQKHLYRFRMNRSFVCGFFKSGTCTAGDECLLLHTFPRNSNAHGDPGAHKEAEQVGSGGFASVKQNKDGGEVPGWWYQRGFGSSELLGGCWGFDGKKGWGAGIGSSNWGKANDGVSSWGKGNYSGGGFALGSQNNYGEGVNWGSWDFDSKSGETNAGGGWETTNTCDDDGK